MAGKATTAAEVLKVALEVARAVIKAADAIPGGVIWTTKFLSRPADAGIPQAVVEGYFQVDDLDS